MGDYIHDITALLPQAPPFLMVDTLLWTDGPTTRSSFRVRADNVLLKNGELSAAGLMENIAQTVAAGAGWVARTGNKPVSPGYIVSVNNLEINAFPALGEELVTETTVKTRVADIVVISGRITCNGMVMATGEMKIIISE
jgi:predicted hotdog family 3-hydroxylacyl-ACP dehydratase